jgi:hypothetical protein
MFVHHLFDEAGGHFLPSLLKITCAPARSLVGLGKNKDVSVFLPAVPAALRITTYAYLRVRLGRLSDRVYWTAYSKPIIPVFS